MTDNPMLLDDMEDYVLGQLTPAACRRFEARLKQDATLRRHIRELEEGALALAMSAPQFRPPPEVWTRIQATVAQKQHYGFLWPGLQLQWLRRGWLVAGGLAVAFFIHLAAVHVSAPVRNPVTPGKTGNQMDGTAVVALPEGTQFAGLGNSNVVNSVAATKGVPASASASGQTGNYSPVENRAWSEEAAATLRDAENSRAWHPSPRLQRALLMTRAHQMGLTNSSGLQAQTDVPAQVQVEYMEMPNPMEFAALEPATLVLGSGFASSTAEPTVSLPDPSETIFMFASGNNLVVAIDPAMLPANSGPVTIWVEDADGNQAVVGTVNPSVNPIVINILNADLGLNYLYMVTTGGTNVLGHFPL